MLFIKKQYTRTFFSVFIGVVILTVLISTAASDDQLSKEEKVLYTNLAGAAAITTWGLVNWDYFQNTPKKSNEGWFSNDTKHGGADKLGHFYFSYGTSHLLSKLYEHFGYPEKKGALLGSISSFGLTTWMEIGDSFSDHGFAYEDVIMNLLGSAAGYLLYIKPGLADKIDLRIEYIPSFDQADFITDYENQKFLMAVKFDGFDFTQDTFLKYLELHVGYYTRGYSDRIDQSRNAYVGVGVNLSRIFKHLSMPKTAKVFNYFQLPYTYLDLDHDFN